MMNTFANSPDRLIKLKEASERLGVCRSTIMRWERLGKMPRRRQIGDTQAWLSREFDAWLAQTPTAPPKHSLAH